MYYLAAGRLISYSICRRGPLPNFLSKFCFDMISGNTDTSTGIPLEALQSERSEIEKVENCSSEEEFDELLNAATGLSSTVDVAGCMPLARYSTKDQLLKRLKEFLAVNRLHEALTQFKQGLSENGLQFYIEAYPQVLEPAFVFEEVTLTADLVLQTFEVHILSEVGSNRRLIENRVLGYWRDLILQLEEMNMLKDLLRFVTGMEAVPPLGFNPTPSLDFRHDCSDDVTKDFPYSNTCANVLYLPLHATYRNFEEHFIYALRAPLVFSDM